MAPIFHTLVARDDDTSSSAATLTPTMFNLLIALLVLVIVGFVLVAGLWILRRRRNSAKQAELSLPTTNRPTSRISNHRRLTITATPYGRKSESIMVYNEKKNLMDNSSSPPPSPVPEIRITLPEEVDDAGKRLSGRVVVVRIGETGGVGLEPCAEENLPPYQKTETERFQSLDLDRMGGLSEKELEHRYA